MKLKTKSTLLAGILATSLAIPAFAGNTPTAQSLSQFTAADTQMMFEEYDKPMQLASLSTQEMKQTEGALLPALIAGAIAGGAAVNYWYTHCGCKS